jgi:hypothetical protein
LSKLLQKNDCDDQLNSARIRLDSMLVGVAVDEYARREDGWRLLAEKYQESSRDDASSTATTLQDCGPRPPTLPPTLGTRTTTTTVSGGTTDHKTTSSGAVNVDDSTERYRMHRPIPDLFGIAASKDPIALWINILKVRVIGKN